MPVAAGVVALKPLDRGGQCGGCVLIRTVPWCDSAGLLAENFLLVEHPNLILWSSQRLLFTIEWIYCLQQSKICCLLPSSFYGLQLRVLPGAAPLWDGLAIFQLTLLLSASEAFILLLPCQWEPDTVQGTVCPFLRDEL